MNFTLDLWQVISLVIALIGAFFGMAKLLLLQTKKQIDEKFASVFKVLDTQATTTQRMEAKHDETARRLERELLELKAELPRDYVRREDYVQALAIVMTKIDALGLRMENMFKELVFKSGGSRE